ncbi:hypothetical protein EMIT0P171_70239 [Pseudomonas sp. IT-P171]
MTLILLSAAGALFCGSRPAGDADNSVYRLNRGDAIAGRPAPTVDRVLSDGSGACR